MRNLVILAVLLGLPSPAMTQEVMPNPAVVKPAVVEPTVKAPVVVPGDVKVEPATQPASAPAKAAGDPLPEPNEPPVTDSEAVGMAMKIIAAAREGHWTLLAGLVLMLLIYVFNRFGMAAKFGTKVVPWVTVVLGMVGSVGYGMSNGELWYVALIYGFFMSSSAIALWELVIKHLTDTKADGTPRKEKLVFEEE